MKLEKDRLLVISPHADDDNLHRRGDEGRAHCRDGLGDYLYQHIQQERMLALGIQ